MTTPEDNPNNMKDEKQQPKPRILRITMTVDYFIEGYESRSLDEIVQDWFVDFPASHGAIAHHAYRDNSEIGGSKRYIKHEEVKKS